jgi:hypothetical protein
MEQVQKHLEKYQALHRELTDERQVMNMAIRERWGDVEPESLLVQAELNSLMLARAKMISDPKKNPWVCTNAQGDLFNSVPVRVPAMLMINGKPCPYYEASILDGLEFWQARQDAKKVEANGFREAAEHRENESAEALNEAEKLDALVRTALDNGVDPRTVMYARAAA